MDELLGVCDQVMDQNLGNNSTRPENTDEFENDEQQVLTDPNLNPLFRKQREMFDCGTVQGMLLNNIQINDQGFLSLYSDKISKEDTFLNISHDQSQNQFKKKKYKVEGETIFPAIHQLILEI